MTTYHFGLRPKHRTRNGPRDAAATRIAAGKGRGKGRAASSAARGYYSSAASMVIAE